MKTTIVLTMDGIKKVYENDNIFNNGWTKKGVEYF
jgi:hypothetical protein